MGEQRSSAGTGSLRPWVPVVAVLFLMLILGIIVGLSSWHIGYGQASTLAAFKMEKAVEKARAECKRELASNALPQLQVGSLVKGDHSRQALRRAVRQERESRLSPPPCRVSLLELPEMHNESVSRLAQELHDQGIRVFVGPETLEDLEELLVWARGRPSPRSHLWIVTPTSGSALTTVGNTTEDVTVITLALEEVPLLFMQMERQGVTRVLPVLGYDARGNEVAAQLEEMVDYLGINVADPFWYSAEEIVESSFALKELISNIDTYFSTMDQDDENAALLLSGGAELGLLASEIGSEFGNLSWFVTSMFAQSNVWSELDVDQQMALQNLNISSVVFTGDYHSTKEWRKEVLDKVSLLEGSDLNPYQTALIYDAGLIAVRIGPWTADSMRTLEEADGTQASVLLARESCTWTGITGNLALTPHLGRSQGHFVDLVLDEDSGESLDQFHPYAVRGRFHAMRRDHPVAIRKRFATLMPKELKMTVSYSPSSWYDVTPNLVKELLQALPNCSDSYVQYTVSDPASSKRDSKRIETILLEEFQVSVNHDLSLDIVCFEGNVTQHEADLALECPGTFDQSMEVMCSLIRPFQCSFRLGKQLESLQRCIRHYAKLVLEV
ncbi:uncharacterized protein LOC143039618 [Oratosquilla oratoria]|uniref:uncharacterized protein LOC143039618 n=1 Tax=Oratosquilla oratoria TaxID=337810 RepID=UPI003F76ECF2